MPKGRASRRLFLAVIVFALVNIGRNVYRRHLDAALLTAVQGRDIEAARSLLARGANVNAGVSPVNHISPVLDTVWMHGYGANNRVSAADEDMICLLIEHGAKFHTDPHATNYLYFACACGSVKIVRCLLEHGADPVFENKSAWPPAKGIVTYYDADRIDAGDASHTDSLQKRRRVCEKLVQLLQEHGVRLNIWQATQLKDLPVLRAALDAGVDVNAREPSTNTTMIGLPLEGSTALQLAAKVGNMEVARLLLERGANVNAVSKNTATPLITAFQYKRYDFVKLLLAHGADPNVLPPDDVNENPALIYGDKTPALVFAINDMPELVPELLKRGANVNVKYSAPLKAAINRHNVPLVRELLQRGANVNPALPSGKHFTVYASLPAFPSSASLASPASPSTGGWLKPFSPLMVAVCNAPESEAILLRAGAKIGPDKDSILPVVIESGRAALLPHLLALGANVNGTNKDGETALSLAIVHAPASVRFLLEHGADPNTITRPSLPRTPLAQAAIAGELECARLLLAHHANVNGRPAQGHTPLYYVRKHNHADIAALLQQAGGKDE